MLLVLIGDRSAILQVASDRWALAIGALFVLSAGLARNYSRVDLQRKPWYLAVPFGASIATSFGLFTWVYVIASWHNARVDAFAENYQSFLGLYWLTAPLAWLYVLPVERWTTRVHAVQVRLGMLGLVATWRVALITRVLYVVLQAGGTGLFCTVMLFVCGVAIFAIVLTSRQREKPEPAPAVISFMGVMPDPERRERRIIRQAGCIVIIVAIACIAICSYRLSMLRPDVSSWQFNANSFAVVRPPSAGLWWVAFGSIFSWLSLLPVTQRQRRLATQVNELYESGDFERALELMIESGPRGFPAGWLPPPKQFGNVSDGIDFLDGVQLVLSSDSGEWLRQHCHEQLVEFCGDGRWFWTTDKLSQLVKVLEQVPDNRSTAAIAWHSLTDLEDYHESVARIRAQLQDDVSEQDRKEFNLLDPTPIMTEERVAARRRLQALAGITEFNEADHRK